MAGISPCTCVHMWSVQQASLHSLFPSLATLAVKNFLLITNLNVPLFVCLNLLSFVLLPDKESFPILLVWSPQVMDESLLHGLKYCIPSMMCSYFSLTVLFNNLGKESGTQVNYLGSSKWDLSDDPEDLPWMSKIPRERRLEKGEHSQWSGLRRCIYQLPLQAARITRERSVWWERCWWDWAEPRANIVLVFIQEGYDGQALKAGLCTSHRTA